jgi:electron transfer flavoprotein alpha subunit
MAILLFAETENRTYKKVAFELASYGRAWADQLGCPLIAVACNIDTPETLGTYGVDTILTVEHEALSTFTVQAYGQALLEVAKKQNVTKIVFSSTANARYLAPWLSVHLNAAYASNVVALPEGENPLRVKRSCFTNKAFNYTSLTTTTVLLGVANNSFGVHEKPKTPTVTAVEVALGAPTLKVTAVEASTEAVTIADADIVVSGGRGLKGPENWHLIEELASTLGAATACSKPVSDMGWRPHSEHVGQTGKPVASNLYIAIGVSGAIQHLAGVNASKVKVVINNDPEAPFFKAAEYGVVGDAFTVVPKLIEKLKAFKAS